MVLTKDTIIAIIFFIMSVILLSQAAITVYTYNKDKKEKDTNFYWSVFVLFISIIGLITAAGMGIYSQRQTAGNGNVKVGANAPSAVAGSVAPQPMMVMMPAGVPAAQVVKGV